MALKINADQSKLDKIAQTLRSDPSQFDSLIKDPKGFLAKHGVEVDAETASALKNKLTVKVHPTANAAIVHIDT